MKVINFFLFFNILFGVSFSLYFTEGLESEIHYIGVDDHDYIFIDRQYSCPLGMDFNSYVIMDEKITIIDTVPSKYCDQWIVKLFDVILVKIPDYIIIHSIEPDQAGCLEEVIKRFPKIKIVASSKFFQLSTIYFGTDFQYNRIMPKEGNELSIGKHEFIFISSAFARWPDSMLSYERTTKTLFSGKLFGNFGGASEEKWVNEARRYYFAMLAGHPKHIQQAVDKVSVFDISKILPFHGPIFKGEKVLEYVGLYEKWSKMIPEDDGVLIAYTYDHGDYKPVITKLTEIFKAMGKNVFSVNLSYNDVDYVVADAFRYAKMVIATTSFNKEINPYVKNFIDELETRDYQNRVVGFIESGTWARFTSLELLKRINKCRNIKLINSIEIINPLASENDKELEKFAKTLIDTKL